MQVLDTGKGPKGSRIIRRLDRAWTTTSGPSGPSGPPTTTAATGTGIGTGAGSWASISGSGGSISLSLSRSDSGGGGSVVVGVDPEGPTTTTTTYTRPVEEDPEEDMAAIAASAALTGTTSEQTPLRGLPSGPAAAAAQAFREGNRDSKGVQSSRSISIESAGAGQGASATNTAERAKKNSTAIGRFTGARPTAHHVPSSHRPNVGCRLGRRKALFEKRKRVSDYSLVMALFGIAMMILENECSAAGLYNKVRQFKNHVTLSS